MISCHRSQGWFFRLQFRKAYDSAYYSDFQFLLGRKLSYDSDYDSNYDSVTSENEPLQTKILTCLLGKKEIWIRILKQIEECLSFLLLQIICLLLIQTCK